MQNKSAAMRFMNGAFSYLFTYLFTYLEAMFEI